MNLSRDGEGRYLGHNGGETRNVHDQLHQIWRGMADEGLISGSNTRKARSELLQVTRGSWPP